MYAAIDAWLMRFRQYRRLVDEDDNPSLASFRQKWACQPQESTDGLRLRHQLIVQKLQDDYIERRSALQSVYQAASVTLAAVSFMVAAVALSVKAVNVHSPQVRLLLLAVLAILWNVFNAYMPRFVKSQKPFMDAGEYVATYAVKFTGELEAYKGELLYRSYAESLSYDLNVRNRILQAARKKLGIAHLVIKVIMVVGVVIVCFRL